MRWIMFVLLLGLPLQAQDKKSADLGEIIELLQSEAPEKREAALEMLRSLAEATPAPEVSLTFVEPMRASAEVMSGSHNINGKRTEYTLRSLGKGRYKLDATVTTPEGEKSEIKDEGTLAELRDKYEFLGDVGAVVLPRAKVWDSRRDFSPRTEAEISIPELGLKVKRPGEELSWHFYVPPGVGYVVTRVDPLSLGHKLGFKPHDLLLKIDGRPIENKTELSAIAKGRGQLEVVRRAKPIKIDFPVDK